MYSVYSGKPSHAVSCSPVIRSNIKSDSFRSQVPTDGSGIRRCPWVAYASTAYYKNGSAVLHLTPGYQTDSMRGKEGLTSVQCMMTWDRLAMYVEQECLDLVLTFVFSVQSLSKDSKYNQFPGFLCVTAARSKYIETEVDSVLA